MARFLVETRKAAVTDFGKFKWSNRYFVQAANAAEALTAGAEIWLEGERQMHSAECYCYEVYANEQGDPPYSVGYTTALLATEQRGARAASGDPLPPFVVVRVDYSVIGSRPSRKFYRPPLFEADTASGQLASGLVTAITTAAAYIAGRGDIVDVDGQDWTGTSLIRGLTSRRLGKWAYTNVPDGPAS